MSNKLRLANFKTIVVAAIIFASMSRMASACLVPSIFLHTRAGHVAAIVPIETVRLDGVKVSMMIDTGSPFSILTPKMAARLSRLSPTMPLTLVTGVAGTVSARTLSIRSVTLGQHHVGSGQFLILPFMHLTLSGDIKVEGVIGRNLLGPFRLSLFTGDRLGACDSSVRRISINPSKPSWAILNGHRIAAILDTGSGVTNMSRHLFHVSGLDRVGGRQMGSVAAIGIGGGVVILKLYQFSSLTVAGHLWHRQLVAVGGIHPGVMQDELILGDNYLLDVRRASTHHR